MCVVDISLLGSLGTFIQFYLISGICNFYTHIFNAVTFCEIFKYIKKKSFVHISFFLYILVKVPTVLVQAIMKVLLS